MPNINWNNDLTVGIESIDEQHRHLIDLFNKLNEAHKRGELTAANDFFYKLIEFKLTHCAYEEQLLKTYDYPMHKMHKQSHEHMMNKFFALRQRAENGEYILNKAIPFFETTLLRHMKGEDADYSTYMCQSQRNNGPKKSLGFLHMLKRVFK